MLCGSRQFFGESPTDRRSSRAGATGCRRHDRGAIVVCSPVLDVNFLLAMACKIDRFNERVGRLMIWCVLASVILAAAAALLRKLFLFYSSSWSELQWYLFGAAFLFSAPYVLRIDEHVRVDVLARRWSTRTRARLDLAALILVSLPICVTMVVLGTEHTWTALRFGERSYMHDGLLLWPVRALVPIGFVLLGLQTLSEIVHRIVLLQTEQQGIRDRGCAADPGEGGP